MFKKSLYALAVLTVVGAGAVFAFQPKETARYFNGPTVASVGSISADLTLSQSVLNDLTDEEKAGIYYEYGETNQVCIMIYPTPESCLPKKTEVGKTNVTITNLKSDTSYTVTYKRDNTIRCITTPCPENGFQSLSVEFKTKAAGPGDVVVLPGDNVQITRNLGIGSRGDQVITLQNVLIQQGYLKTTATGYYGLLTFKAVREFQSAHSISPVGLVGPLTRAVLEKMTVSSFPVTSGIAEKFEGTVTAYSTACFADGECSITVDGKKVITTIGWSQMIVGKVTGIPDFGSIENNIGAHAKVYAKKVETGYTLYGNADYYIEITPAASRKLPAGSTTTSPSSVIGNTWVWQKTVLADGSVTTPKKTDKFSVTFGTDGKLSGTTDCNGFFGSYTFGTDGFITFGPIGSTLMFCDGSQEAVFTGAIGTATRYSIDASGSLTLTLANNAGTVYFSKK